MAKQPAYLDPPVQPRGTGHHVLRRTIPLFHPYRWRMLAAAIFVSITCVLVSTMPLFTRYVIDVAIPRRDFPLAVLVMGAFVALMILRMVSWYFGQMILLMVREKIIFALRSKLFARMQNLCLRFHHRYSPGYLYDRTLGGATTSVGAFLSMLFNTLVGNGVTLVSSLTICYFLNWKLALLVMIIGYGYVMIARYFRGRIQAMTSRFNKETNIFAGKITDYLRGVMTIKAFAMEQRMISEFDEQLWPLQLRSLDLNKETMRLGFNAEGLGYFITAVIVVSGAYLVLGGNISLGTMIAFISYQSMVTGMFGALTTIAGAHGAAMAGLEQIYEVLDEHSSVPDKKGAVMPAEIRGQLTLDDVHFSLDDKPIINGISITIPPGQSVALVGPSGGGKTTLINLILRFYDPDRGVIRLDGQDIRNLPSMGYHHLFGVVLQDPFLFNDTIFHNLRAVKPDATEEEMREALERAQAWEFVAETKDGLHHKVGEDGNQISGGQRQRLAIARCFLTDPRFMILDEATSALDTQSELLVQEALNDLMKNRNVFIIAHRLSTVRNVDRILVLQEGRIVQDGRYDELCRTPGLFRDLHMATLSTG